jgi:hypothetical protein
MHVLGAEAAVVGVASVATAFAAHASTSQQAPATARIVIVPRGRDENSPARRSAMRPRFSAPLTVRRPLTLTRRCRLGGKRKCLLNQSTTRHDPQET